jgi:hypothetical protein
MVMSRLQLQRLLTSAQVLIRGKRVEMRTICLLSAQQRKTNRHCWAYATMTLRQWIRQAARRARPHQAVFSTTQTLTMQSHVDPKPFLRRQSRRLLSVSKDETSVDIMCRRF